MLPGIIAALGSVASMGLNSVLDRQSMNHQAHLNEDALRQQYMFNDILNQNSYNRSFDQWLQEFNYQNDYNLPLNQRARMEAAGLNYLAMMQGQSGGAAGGTIPQSNPSVSSPSVGLPSVGISQTASVDLPRAMSAIASAFKSFSESSRQDADTELVKRTMSDIVRKYALDNEAQTMANAVSNLYTKWMTSAIYNQDGSVSSTNAVRKFNAEYQKILEEVALISTQAKTANSQSVLNDTMNDLQQRLKPVYEKDKAVAEGIMARVHEYVDNVFRLQNMQIDTGYTNAAANMTNASANMTNARTQASIADSVRTLNYALADFNSAKARGQNQQNMLFDATRQEQISNAFVKLEREGIINKTLNVQLDMALKNRDWQTVEKIMSVAVQTSNILLNSSKALSY